MVRLNIDPSEPSSRGSRVVRALANDTRLQILRHLGDRHIPVVQIAEQLGLPLSTASLHIAVLEQAELVHTTVRPASRGLQKICSRTYDEVLIRIPSRAQEETTAFQASLPIGSYTDCRVEGPNCGLASATGLIGFLGDPGSFYEPDRHLAQLIWFRAGHLDYRLPNRMPSAAVATALEISVEVCSEAPGSDPDWPSDIGIEINGRPIGTWRSPSDFGGRRGILTPLWWDIFDTQHGVLKVWRVDATGTSIDGEAASAITIADLGLVAGELLLLRIGVDPAATNVGGLNLFGSKFGDHPQDIELRIEYTVAGAVGTIPEDGDVEVASVLGDL
jgi:predicted transcriptional regulator